MDLTLNCPICSRHFSDVDKELQPHLLPCQHDICFADLKQLRNKACPICSASFVESLGVDRNLVRVIKVNKADMAERPDDPRSRDFCLRHHDMFVYYCQNHSVGLCPDCVEFDSQHSLCVIVELDKLVEQKKTRARFLLENVDVAFQSIALNLDNYKQVLERLGEIENCVDHYRASLEALSVRDQEYQTDLETLKSDTEKLTSSKELSAVEKITEASRIKLALDEKLNFVPVEMSTVLQDYQILKKIVTESHLKPISLNAEEIEVKQVILPDMKVAPADIKSRSPSPVGAAKRHIGKYSRLVGSCISTSPTCAIPNKDWLCFCGKPNCRKFTVHGGWYCMCLKESKGYHWTCCASTEKESKKCKPKIEVPQPPVVFRAPGPPAPQPPPAPPIQFGRGVPVPPVAPPVRGGFGNASIPIAPPAPAARVGNHPPNSRASLLDEIRGRGQIAAVNIPPAPPVVRRQELPASQIARRIAARAPSVARAVAQAAPAPPVPQRGLQAPEEKKDNRGNSRSPNRERKSFLFGF
jgi:hypothetical protein